MLRLVAGDFHFCPGHIRGIVCWGTPWSYPINHGDMPLAISIYVPHDAAGAWGCFKSNGKGIMGVASSTEAGSASQNAMDTSRSPTRRSPKRRGKVPPGRSRSVNEEGLRRALRDQGLCISESDMTKVLAKHSDVLV